MSWMDDVLNVLPSGLTQKDFKTLYRRYKQRGDQKRIRVRVKAKRGVEDSFHELASAGKRPEAMTLALEAGGNTPLELLGLYYSLYKDWCGALPGGSPTTHLLHVTNVTKREGYTRARQGIEALFGSSMRWAKNKGLYFLVDEDKWGAHIAPAIASDQKRGKEQAEWEDDEDTGEYIVRRGR